MKYILLLFLLISKMSMASNLPTLDFVKTLGGTSDDGAYDLVVDKNDNIYVIGWYSGTIDLDPGVSTFMLPFYGDRDIFVAKYDSIGNFIWGFGIGSTAQDEGGMITLDSLGNIVIAGRFSDVLDFDPGIGIASRASIGDRDFYLAKYDSLGNLIWVNSMGGIGYDDAEDVVVDLVGNIYLAGSFVNAVDFDPGPGLNLMVSNGNDDTFISCYSPMGNLIWVRTFGGNFGDDISGIELDGKGNIYASGYFSGMTDFDGNMGVYNVTSVGSNDIFVVKYDVNGNFHFVKTIGGVGFDAAYGIDLYNDKLYLTGTFSNTVDFDPSLGAATKNSLGLSDIFLMQLDTLGNFNWVNTAGGIEHDIGMDVGVDQYGFVVGTGMFRSNSTFSGGSGIKNLVALGDKDIFLDRFDSNGTLIHAFSISSLGVEISHTLYLNSKNNALYVSGVFGGLTDFDPSASINTSTIMNGITDVFFAKYSYNCDSLSPLQIIYGNNTVCEGDTVVFNADTLSTCDECVWVFPTGSVLLDSLGATVVFIAGSSSGMLEVFKSNSCFYTQTVYFPLQINNKSFTMLIDSICSGLSYVFPDGTIGTTDTVHFSNFVNQMGCDSIIVTNLKITQPVLISDSITICDGTSYFFHGSNYNVSGNYSYNISTPGFCDTTYMLNLLVLPPNLTLQNGAFCEGDTLWVGSVPHTTTGIYIDTLLSAISCDSIVISSFNFTIIDTSVLVSSSLFTSNQSNAFYQWCECGTVLTPIQSAVFQSFSALQNGSYAVVINLNGCVDTSRCFNMVNTSITDLNSIGKVMVTPNPVMDRINVVSSVQIEEVLVYSIEGKLLVQEKVSDVIWDFNVRQYAPAFYIVKVLTKSELSQFRILKL